MCDNLYNNLSATLKVKYPNKFTKPKFQKTQTPVSNEAHELLKNEARELLKKIKDLHDNEENEKNSDQQSYEKDPFVITEADRVRWGHAKPEQLANEEHGGREHPYRISPSDSRDEP